MTADRKLAIEVAFPGLAQSIVERVEESKRRSDEAHALVRTQAEQLYASVKNAAAGDGADDSKTIAALRDHWWVERQENGKWIPMDVLLPDAKSGTTLAAASRISEWTAESDAPLIPESEWHAVQVRVVIERYDGTVATEATLLETNLRPATVFDRPITLMHMPRPWPEHLPDFKTDPNALGNAAVSVKEWVPFLRIGGEQIAQSGFTESGDLVADPLNPRRDIAKVGGGGFMTGFGEALGGAKQPHPS